MAIEGSATTVIEAPIAEVFGVAADVEGSPRWQPEIKVAECEEHGPNGEQVLVHIETDAKVRTLTSEMRFSYDEPDGLSWVQEEGDLKSVEGSWEFEDLGDGTNARDLLDDGGPRPHAGDGDPRAARRRLARAARREHAGQAQRLRREVVAMRALAAGVAAGCVAVFAGGTTAAAAERPRTIPALREWTPGEGAYELRSGARIVIPVKHRRVLRDTAKTFAADLRSLTRISVPVVSGRRVKARRGDIRLRLGARDAQLGREGYRMRSGGRLMIAANSAPGAFYATRTALQLLRQHKQVPAGLARDWPRYPERGLMVDIGRKHFTLAWLEARIRELAYLKLNQLHLHFTDNEGWRIESKSHPEVVSTPHLTREQVRGLIAYAARRHVRVIPEIDMPGHMRAALARHPELQLRDASGVAPPPTSTTRFRPLGASPAS